MELWALLGVLLTLGLLLGAVFGWIALFQARSLRRDVNALRVVVARLRSRAEPAEEEALAPAVATPKPAPEPAPKSAPEAVREAPARPAPAAEPIPVGYARRKHPSLFETIERSLAGNWLVLVAGATLALGGVFLVKYAIDQGLLGPWPRVILAASVGGALVAAGEQLRRKGFSEGPLGHSAAPAATAGAGLVVIYGAVYAAFGLYELIAGPVAFAALAAVAAGAVALALVHGPALVALGLVGAFAAPLLIGSDEPNAPGLFAYVFAVAAVGLAVTRLVGRRWPALVALAGGALWPLLWLVGGYQAHQAWALAAYLPALLAAAIAFAWSAAEHSPALAARRGLVTQAPVSVTAAYLAALAVFALLQLLAAVGDHPPAAVVACGAAAALALGAAWRREALLGLPLIALAGAAVLAYTWPEARTIVIDSDLAVARAITSEHVGPQGPAYVPVLLAFAALFGVGGLLAQDRLRVKGAMAAATVGGPALMLAIGFWRVTGLAQDIRWALAASALAAACVLLLERLARSEDGLDAAPGPASAYALGAGAAAGMAVGMALDELWMSVGFAALVPLAAALHRRFALAPLTWLAAGFATLTVARLTIFGEALDYDIRGLPIVNSLLWGYGVPIAALWGGARVFERNGLTRDGRIVQTLEGGALVLGVAFISLEIRHLMNGGDLDAPYFDSLAEAGLQTSAWLGGALALRWRLGPRLHFAQRWVERALIALGVGQCLIVHLVVLNPWRGYDPPLIEGPPVANLLALAYALPAALAAAYAVIARRQGYRRVGTIAGLAGAAMAFAWLTLEIRRGFHAPDLDVWGVADAENYVYSAAWVVFAFVLLGLGALRRRPTLRYAAHALLALVTLKVFFVDMRDLTGVLRGLSFLGVGGALMVIALLYQRFMSIIAPPEQPRSPRQ